MNKLYRDVSIGTNEIVSKFSINRNIGRLLHNDQYIYKLYNKYLMSGPGVFIKGLKYPLGYKVWYRDAEGKLGIYTNTIDNNIQEPTSEDSNWINTSVNGATDMSHIYEEIAEKALQDHIENYHNIDNSLVKRDLSNSTFDLYPYETRRIKNSNGLVTGYLRKWKTNILEYFLIFNFQDTTVTQLTPSELKRYFGGILNSYGTDLKTYSNPDIPSNVNEYLETSNIRSINIKFIDNYKFSGTDYCIFTSNSLDCNGILDNVSQTADKNNYSPVDTLQIVNKSEDGFQVIRRFNGSSYDGYVLNDDSNTKNVYRKLRPADKSYTLYIIGSY